MKRKQKKTSTKYLVNEGDEKILNKQEVANSFKQIQEEIIFVPNESNGKREHYMTKQWYDNTELNKN